MGLKTIRYKQTEVGLIPVDWDCVKMGDVGNTIIGLTYSKKDIADYGTLVLRSSNIQSNQLAYEDNVFVDMDLPQKVIVKEDDILICVRNGSKKLIGKCALIDKKAEGHAFGAFMSIYRSEFSKYIYYSFQSNIIKRQIDETLGATINQLTNRNLFEFKIPLPKKPEQKAIAKVLSDTDALIKALEKKIAKKKLIKKGMMQKLLTPKKGWSLKKLGNLCETITTGKLDANAMVKDGAFRFYTCAKEYYYIDNYSFDTEALLVSGNGANVGYIHYYKGKFNAYQRTYVLSGFKQNILFIKQFMDKYLKFRIDEQKNDGNTPYIKMDTLTEMEIYYPPIEEQKQIVHILTDIDKEIAQLVQKLSKYQLAKQGMMQQLLSGKTRLV